MSGLVMGLVWELPIDDKFGRAEKYILLAYADHADQNGNNIFPSIDLVSRKTGYAERAVQMTTRMLQKLGYLVATGMGPNGTNRWRIPVLRSEGGAKIAPLPMLENAPEGNAPEPKVVVKDSTATPDAPPKSKSEPPAEKPNIFKLYEQNIGMLTPLIADDLRDLEKTYPPDWVEYAFREAIGSGARNLKYIRAILERIKKHGFDSKLPERRANNYDRSKANRTSEPAQKQPEYTDADRELAARIKSKAQQAQV